MLQPNRSKHQLLLGSLLCAFILSGLLYAWASPLFEVSDELWHYPMVKTLADGNGLPVQDPANVGLWRQEGSQPPLYYLLMAFVTRPINTDDLPELRRLNLQADVGLVTEDGNNNMLIHRLDEGARWTGAALATRLIRWLSVLLAAAGVYATYRFVLTLWPGRGYMPALAAAAFVGFNPMFGFISASVNNDTLTNALSALILWRLAAWVRKPPATLGWQQVVLGLLLGAGALSKQSALGLIGLAGLVVLYSGLRSPIRWRTLALNLLTIFGLAFVVAFWWYWRNVQLYGDWLGWSRFLAIAGARSQPASLAQLWDERVGFIQSYWGLFGGVNIPMPDWIYTLLNSILLLAAMGWLIGIVRGLRSRVQLDRTQMILWALPVIWLVLIFIGLYRWTSVTPASQGRLIFPAQAAIAALVIGGLDHLLPTHAARRWGLGLLTAALFALTLAVPVLIIHPHYTPPTRLTPGEISGISHPVNADFGAELRLLGYDLPEETLQPGEPVRVRLYWQCLAANTRDWSLFLHLLDEDELLNGQRDRYPGQGLIATTLLQPGQTFADDVVIELPAVLKTPARLHLQVGLYDYATGERLKTSDGAESVYAGTVEVPTTPWQINFGNQMLLTALDYAPSQPRPGDALTVTLHWQSLHTLHANYAVSVRARDASGRQWAVQDAWPQSGAAPTSGWTASTSLADTYTLALPADMPPGAYHFELIVYDSATQTPLKLVSAQGRITDAVSARLYPFRVR